MGCITRRVGDRPLSLVAAHHAARNKPAICAGVPTLPNGANVSREGMAINRKTYTDSIPTASAVTTWSASRLPSETRSVTTLRHRDGDAVAGSVES